MMYSLYYMHNCYGRYHIIYDPIFVILGEKFKISNLLQGIDFFLTRDINNKVDIYLPTDDQVWESSTSSSYVNQHQLDSTARMDCDPMETQTNHTPGYICIEETSQSKQPPPSVLTNVPIEVLNSKHVDKLTKELKKALGPCHNFIHGTCLLGNSCLYSHDPQKQISTDQKSPQKPENDNIEKYSPKSSDIKDRDLPATRPQSKDSPEVNGNSNSSNNQVYTEQESKEEGECTDQDSASTVCLDEIEEIEQPNNDSVNSSSTVCEDEFVDRLLESDKSEECNQSVKGIFSGLYSEPESDNNSSDSDIDFSQVSTSNQISPESAIAPTLSAMTSVPKVPTVNPRRPHKNGGAQWKPAFRDQPTNNTSLSRITGPTRTEMAEWNQAYHYVEAKGQPRKAFSVKPLEEKPQPSMIPTIGSNRPERSTDYYDNRTT